MAPIWKVVAVLATSLVTLTTSDSSDYGTKFTIRCNAKWIDFSNAVLQLLVNGKLFTHQQAINFLRTFSIQGTGDFSDYTASGIVYTSATYSETFGGDQGAASIFSFSMKQLIKERDNCVTYQASANPVRCIDQSSDILEAMLKLLISNQLITTQNATTLAIQFGATLTVIQDESTGDFGCLQKMYDFKKTCESQFGGVADGARCFFVPNGDRNNYTLADNAWGVCKSKGGILATILTQSELSKIAGLLNPKYGNLNYWISGKRATPSNVDTTGTTCGFARNNSYIYNSITDYNPNLVFGNTWYRNRACTTLDGTTVTTEQCLYTNVYNFGIGDALCNNSRDIAPSLCQVTGPPQQFVRIDKVCLTEIPGQEINVTSTNQCSQSCGQASWCRSFNIVGGIKCQMFPWSYDDKPNSGSSSDCAYYNYFSW